jgi:hypothetical protein
MAKAKKRPSKAAKAAKKIVNESKLLTKVNTLKDQASGSEFRPSVAPPKPADAIKPRPDKKRG